MDPLRCLRLFCSENKLSEVKLVDNNTRVLFGDEYEFPADVETNFISINGRPYSLCSLLFYIQNHTLESSKYYKKALQARIAQVYHANQSLKDYLFGCVDHLPSVPGESGYKRKHEAVEAEPHHPAVTQPKYCRSDLEKNLRSRENLLIVAGKDFSNVLKIYNIGERAAKEQLDKATRTQGNAPSSTHPKSSRLDRGPVEASKQHQQLGVNIYASGKQPRPPQGRPQPKPGHPPRSSHGSQKGRPIIIVPEGVSALMSLANTQVLLQDGTFMTASCARSKLEKPGEKLPQVLLVSRPSVADPNRKVEYELVDQPPSKGSSRWERVVGVICQGKKWQFKEYPFKGADGGDLVELFSSIAGFYFHYRDEAVPETVKSWNVTPLALDRSTRYSDIQTVQTFFQALTRFLDNKLKSRSRKGCRPDKVHYK